MIHLRCTKDTKILFIRITCCKNINEIDIQEKKIPQTPQNMTYGKIPQLMSKSINHYIKNYGKNIQSRQVCPSKQVIKKC